MLKLFKTITDLLMLKPILNLRWIYVMLKMFIKRNLQQKNNPTNKSITKNSKEFSLIK